MVIQKIQNSNSLQKKPYFVKLSTKGGGGRGVKISMYFMNGPLNESGPFSSNDKIVIGDFPFWFPKYIPTYLYMAIFSV